MLLLTSTSDKLQIISIITSQASSIDVHASWVDNASNNITPGRTNSVITTATTTNVIAAPAAGVRRKNYPKFIWGMSNEMKLSNSLRRLATAPRRLLHRVGLDTVGYRGVSRGARPGTD